MLANSQLWVNPITFRAGEPKFLISTLREHATKAICIFLNRTSKNVRGWRDRSTSISTYCISKGPEFCSQKLH